MIWFNLFIKYFILFYLVKYLITFYSVKCLIWFCLVIKYLISWCKYISQNSVHFSSNELHFKTIVGDFFIFISKDEQDSWRVVSSSFIRQNSFIYIFLIRALTIHTLVSTIRLERTKQNPAYLGIVFLWAVRHIRLNITASWTMRKARIWASELQ